MSINKVFISGNLTRDPELRSTASGMPVMQFGVAVNDRRKNSQTGEWEDNPNFIDCTMFGNRAESVSRFITKGSKVAIEGKLRWSQWEKDGQKRSKIEVIVDEIEFMSGQSASEPAYAPQPAPAPAYNPQAQYAPQMAAQPAYQCAPTTGQAVQQAVQGVQQQVAGYQPQPALYSEDIRF